MRVPEGRGVGAMVYISISDCGADVKGNPLAIRKTLAQPARVHPRGPYGQWGFSNCLATGETITFGIIGRLSVE